VAVTVNLEKPRVLGELAGLRPRQQGSPFRPEVPAGGEGARAPGLGTQGQEAVQEDLLARPVHALPDVDRERGPVAGALPGRVLVVERDRFGRALELRGNGGRAGTPLNRRRENRRPAGAGSALSCR
jgi:hypothetical protein